MAYYQFDALHSTDITIRNQADIAERQLRLLEADQRPWVGMHIVTLVQGQANEKFEVKFTLKNFGRGPALNLGCEL